MTVTATQMYCRIAINIRGHVVDVPLHSYNTVGDTLSDLIPYLIDEMKLQGKNTEWLEDPKAHWRLLNFSKRVLDEEKTLAEQKVLDGHRLFLSKDDPGEQYVPLIDDVAESITYFLNKHFPSWDAPFAKKVTLGLLPVVVAVVCATTVAWSNTHLPGWTVRGSISGAMAAVALLCAAIAVVIVRTDEDDEYPAVPLPLMVVTYLFASTAALVLTPRPLGIYQLLAAASAVLTLAVFLSVLTRANLRLHYGLTAASIVTIAVCLLNMAYQSPTPIIGIQLIAGCFFVVLISARLALAVARISLPRVPATGEPFMSDQGAGNLDAGSLPRDGSSGRAIESIFNQEQQTLAAYECRMGLLAGALSVLVAASWVVGRSLNVHQWLIWSFMIVIAQCLIYRGKSLDDAREQATVLIAGAASWALFAAGLLTSPMYADDNTLRGAIALGILLVAMVVATINAVQQRRINSPIVLKVIETVERILYVSPLPFIAFAMDLYSKARAH
ncbi:type VII secretion integral membrane protein EccD [Mycobacterium sp. CBMA 213]|uniref:ESX-1 secretion system protein EccD1 n=1 Tax=Mycolicibacterium sp. CBMA 213 TaxID=1968788 RepID=A0A343VR43_9MYCO|nr:MULTISPECIES: type VII secretion integral membrane protein EccD [unclassified Mycolicibacterium]AVN58367.1 ESX-1 secretion system protein EccD1 [Mycolicibacterium sp. CBMA 213]MUM03268.1 type VII secretion integral membrane protein EccD [Mycolicibacterium sp. CBMA 213]